MSDLLLVAGFGNPGREYAATRHNAGFMVVDHLALRWKVEWSSDRRHKARTARGSYAGKSVLLVQPQTFMNASGEAVQSLAGFYRVPVSDMLIVVDDADLPLGQLRMKPSGGPGGHHGLESVERQLGSRNYARQRVGIGRTTPGVREITGHVLGKFGEEEQPLLGRVIERAAKQIERMIEAGLQQAMNEFNGAVDALPEKEK